MANEKRLIDAMQTVTKMSRRITPLLQMGANPVQVYNEALQVIAESPTVDAAEVADMREFAEDVVYQFGYYGQHNGRLHISNGGLSTLEWAFDILGWDNPHPAPEFECEIDGCHEHATCGAPTNDGYKRMCGRHCRELRKERQ